MSIKTDILRGMNKSRRKYHNSYQLDNFATMDCTHNGSLLPQEHSVRARISELTSAGEIIRVAPNKYTIHGVQHA